MDHLGTLDNYNARSKFPLHSSTLMKNPIRLGGGGVTSQEVMCSEAHCILGFIFLLLVFLGHHFQRMINNLYPIK